MHHVGMQKHVGEERRHLRDRDGVVGPLCRAPDDAHLYEFGRDDGKTRPGRKPETGKLQDEHEHVGGNDADRHPLVAEKLERVVIRERNEEQALVLPRLRLRDLERIGLPPPAATAIGRQGFQEVTGPTTKPARPPWRGEPARAWSAAGIGATETALQGGARARLECRPPANSFVMRVETLWVFRRI